MATKRRTIPRRTREKQANLARLYFRGHHRRWNSPLDRGRLTDSFRLVQKTGQVNLPTTFALPSWHCVSNLRLIVLLGLIAHIILIHVQRVTHDFRTALVALLSNL
jgi:hypothetical protein